MQNKRVVREDVCSIVDEIGSKLHAHKISARVSGKMLNEYTDVKVFLRIFCWPGVVPRTRLDPRQVVTRVFSIISAFFRT